jgi:hypothetical protein
MMEYILYILRGFTPQAPTIGYSDRGSFVCGVYRGYIARVA